MFLDVVGVETVLAGKTLSLQIFCPACKKSDFDTASEFYYPDPDWIGH